MNVKTRSALVLYDTSTQERTNQELPSACSHHALVPETRLVPLALSVPCGLLRFSENLIAQLAPLSRWPFRDRARGASRGASCQTNQLDDLEVALLRLEEPRGAVGRPWPPRRR